MGTMTFDVETLEKIRNTIIAAMITIDLKIDRDYKLSKVRDDSPQFKIEILNHRATIKRIKNTMKHHFTCVPRYGNDTAFMRLNVDREYDHLLGLQMQKVASA